ncbi:septal ring lytic transglycosylase RlpA family protein [Polaromonas sp.]|uniref:septal ring lytic transglycosylase RlpA family protein n=1 Tax=Polaromonas sp. TaxID=1869339 RepID=UPI003BA85E3D
MMMKQGVIRQASSLVLGLALLAWLAACSTAPPSPETPATGPAASRAPAKAPAKPVAKSAASTGAAEAASMPEADSPTDFPRPALLAGEPAREFERGGASWYGPGFHGKRTASGERYDMHAFTAAHRTLPFGTMVRVHSLVNGRDVDVRITDRGPFSRNRVIDVSRAAAEELGMLGLGFKEVVLLVPESTPEVVESLPSPPVKKARRARPSPKPKTKAR